MDCQISLSVTMAHASPVWSLLNLLGRMVLSTNWSTSNGQAESAVKIVKSGQEMSGETLETKLSRFLQDNTPYPNRSYTSRTADEKEVTDKSGQIEVIYLYHCTPSSAKIIAAEIPS